MFHYLANGTYQSFLDIEELTSLSYGVEMSKVPVLFQKVPSENVLHMSSKIGQLYACVLPAVRVPFSTESEDLPASSDLIVKILDGVLNETCHIHTDGWWTYKLCYKKTIEQYHSTEAGEIEGVTTLIGVYVDEDDWSDDKVTKQNTLDKVHNHRYENGSLCDLTSKLRRAQVQFTCLPVPGREDGIVSITEPLSCEYKIVLHFNKLCAHPLFRPEPTEESKEIICSPALPSEQYENYLRKIEAEKNRKDTLLNRLRLSSFMDDDEDDDDEDDMKFDTNLQKSQNDNSEESSGEEKDDDADSTKSGDPGDSDDHLMNVLHRSKYLLKERNRLTTQFSDLLVRVTAEVERTKDLISTVEATLEAKELDESDKKWYNKMLVTLKKSHKKYQDQTKLLKSKYHQTKHSEQVATTKLEKIDQTIRQRKILSYFLDALKLHKGSKDEEVEGIDKKADDITEEEKNLDKDTKEDFSDESDVDGVEAVETNRLMVTKFKTKLVSLMKRYQSEMMAVTKKLNMADASNEKSEKGEGDKKDSNQMVVGEETQSKEETGDKKGIEEEVESNGEEAKHAVESKKVTNDKIVGEQDDVDSKDNLFDSGIFKDSIKVRVRPMSNKMKEQFLSESEVEGDESMRSAELKRAAKGLENIVKKKLKEAGMDLHGSVKVKIITSRKDFDAVAGEDGSNVISDADSDQMKELFLGFLGGGVNKQREEKRLEDMESSYKRNWKEDYRDEEETDL